MDPTPKDEQPKRRRKLWPLFLGGLVVALFATKFALGPILESILKDQLEGAGWDFESIVVGSPGLGGIDGAGVVRLQFPEGSGVEWLSVDSLFFKVNYKLSELFGKHRVEDVHIHEVVISLDFEKWKPQPDEGKPLPDIREFPTIFLESLPSSWPVDKVTTDKILVHIKRNGKTLHTIPVQFAFDGSGKLDLQAPYLQFDSSLEPADGRARAGIKYQLERLPAFIGELIPGVEEWGSFEGLVFNAGMSVQEDSFGVGTLNASLRNLTTPYGALETPSLSFEIDPNLQPRLAIFKANFNNVELDGFSAGSGRVELVFNEQEGLKLEASSDGGRIQFKSYQNLDLEIVLNGGRLEASGAIITREEKVPWKASLEHPFLANLDSWFRTPDLKFPEMEDPMELVDDLDISIGPAEITDSPALNAMPTGLPETILSGVFNIFRMPGEMGGRIVAKDAALVFPETGLKVSGAQTDLEIAKNGLPYTIGNPLLEIGKISFGKLLLENGKIPFQLLVLGAGDDAKNILTSKGITFDTLGGKLGLWGTNAAIDGYDTRVLANVTLADIQLSEALELVDDFPVQLDGKFKGGSINFQYYRQQMTLMNGTLGLNDPGANGESSGASLKYDAKGAFSKGLEPGTPAYVNMQRLEAALADLVFTQFTMELAPLGDPGLVLAADITAKHEAADGTIGLDLEISLYGAEAEGGASLAVAGTLFLDNESIPWKSHIHHPFFGKLAEWFLSPATQLPGFPDPQELVAAAAVEVGPVALEDSGLVNWLVPDLPTLAVTGEVSATRKPGEEFLLVSLDIQELAIPGQEVTISGLRTDAAIGWNPAPHTVEEALLTISRIEVKNWILENAKLPWQLFKEGVLQTPGGEVATFGGFIKLGATSVVLNGPETVTTGLFRLQDIDFEQVLGITDSPPLFLQAAFDGGVPFVLEGDNLQLMPGSLHLKAGTSALLKYNAKGQFTQNQEPGTLGWKNMDMAEKALKDLKIEDLTLKLYPENDRNLPLQAMVKGSHDTGKRKINLDLTLNLRGDVKAILEQAAKGKLELSP